MKLGTVKSRVTLGSVVRVHLQTGSMLDGTLLEIDEDCLIVAGESGEVLLMADAVSMIEVKSSAPRAPERAAPVPPTPPPAAVLEPPPVPLVLPAAANTSLDDLAKRISEVRLEVPEPIFRIVADEEGVSTRLVQLVASVGDRYNYALKIREADRVVDCIRLLRSIAHDYDYPEALQIAGRLAWRLGDGGQARDLLAEAADALDDPSSCFDLAMAQRLTDEADLAPGNLAGCLAEADLEAEVPAWLALLAVVQQEDRGHADLARVLAEASCWEPGPGRLNAFWGGLLCVRDQQVLGIDGAAWDDPAIAVSAFAILIDVLAPGAGITVPAPVPSAPSPAPVAAPLKSAGPSPLMLVGRSRPATPVSPPVPPGPPKAAARPMDKQLESLATEVRGHLRAGQWDKANEIVGTLRRLAPSHATTWTIEREVSNARRALAEPAARPATPDGAKAPPAKTAAAPKAGPYQRAERASQQNNTARAMELWHEAINVGDEPGKAVRRLAYAYLTQRRDWKRALQLLDANEGLNLTSDEEWRWSQLRTTVLEHGGKWPAAATQLRAMLTPQVKGEERAKLVGRLAMALLKTFQHGTARELLEQELELNNGQPALRRVYEQLLQASRTGVYSKVEATLLMQAGQTTGLSPLLAFHLRRCEYRGVRAESVATGSFGEDDIKRLDNLVSGRSKDRVLGTDFPRERADYNLSAARIMQDLGITDDRFHSRLRYFAAAMGDAYALESHQNGDVIRAYYAEAIGAKPAWEDLVDVKLRQFVLSFTKPDSRLLQMSMLPGFEPGLAEAMETKHLTGSILIGLLSLRTSGETATRIIRRIWADQSTRALVQEALTTFLESGQVADEAAFTKTWLAASEQVRRRQDEIKSKLRYVTDLLVEGLHGLEQHPGVLEAIATENEVDGVLSGLDRTRIQTCLHFVSDVRQYLAQTAYVERERLCGSTVDAIRTRKQQFEGAPTLMSLELLVPYLDALERELSRHFATYSREAEPDKLKVELVVDRYLPNGGVVDVQLQVFNPPSACPVSNVELILHDSDDYLSAEDNRVQVAQSIAPGESATCRIALLAAEPAVAQQIMTLRCATQFILRSGRRVEAEVEPKSIRLHADTDWEDIPNPYRAGPLVRSERMFVGREQLLDELVETVSGIDEGSVVVFGQKRAGKSSVLYHLQKKLDYPNVPILFSMQDLASDGNFPVLLYKIAYECYDGLGQMPGAEGVERDMPEPDIDEIRRAPQQKFIEYMRNLTRRMSRTSSLSNGKLVLLIDEFSLVHKWIATESVPMDFMKSWKAMLEAGLFRCVLVGNDLMPGFIEQFPNEFQVARQERVSYLDPKSAIRLIVWPTEFPDGTNRFRGDAAERIHQLTAGSAYYIQLFCERLVQYMNSEDVRAPVVGPADIEAVTDRLVRGPVPLHRSEFDNLLTPGDAEVTAISSDLAQEILRATANDWGRAMYHEVTNEVLTNHPRAQEVIDDLLRREVLEQITGSRYRIRVGLFSEWLQHQWS